MTGFFTPVSMQTFDTDPEAFSTALGRSFRETGFAVITDHALDQNLIDQAVSDTKAFFALPGSVKARYIHQSHGGQRGYTPFGTENAKGRKQADLKEFWHTGRAGLEGTPLSKIMPQTPSVTEIDGFDASTCALYDALDALGTRLLEAIALDIDLPRHWFKPRIENGNSILRLLHYPAQPTPPPEGSERAAAHEDINVITLLLGAEEAGLEVLHRSGKWLAVNPPKGALVVNIGDMLSRLTQSILPSTTHRVVNPAPDRSGHARYSTPFFLHFAPDVLIDPLESCDQHGRLRPDPITAHDFLMERLIEIGLIKA